MVPRLPRILLPLVLAAACGPYHAHGAAEPLSIGYVAYPAPRAAEERGADLTVELFYEALAPYGEWMEHPTFGIVWAPDDPAYVPYSKGQWEYTEHGFTWVSADPFGWAVCHYGRWVLTDRWLWVPGTEWAPAWVVWREGGGVAGWAPLPPDGWTEPAPETFVFVDVSYLLVTEVHHHYYAGWAAVDAYASTQWVEARAHLPGGGSYCPGPSADRLRRRGVTVRVSRLDPRGTGRVGVRSPGERPRVSVRSPGERPRVSVRSPGERPRVSVRSPGERPRVHVWRTRPAWDRRRSIVLSRRHHFPAGHVRVEEPSPAQGAIPEPSAVAADSAPPPPVPAPTGPVVRPPAPHPAAPVEPRRTIRAPEPRPAIRPPAPRRAPAAEPRPAIRLPEPRPRLSAPAQRPALPSPPPAAAPVRPRPDPRAQPRRDRPRPGPRAVPGAVRVPSMSRR